MAKKGKRGSTGRRRALADHKQDGKVLQPPFLAGLAAASGKLPGERPEIHGHTWHDDIMPELFWLALLYRQRPARTCAIVTALIRTTAELVQTTPPCIFAFASQYSRIPSDLCSVLQGKLEEQGILPELLTVLTPQRILFPECPMNILFEGRELAYTSTREEATKHAIEACRSLTCRRSADAAVIQGMAVLGMGLVHPGIAPYPIGFEHLHVYPQTLESRTAEKDIRLIVGSLSAIIREDAAWRNYFWRQGFAITPCWPAPSRFHGGVVDSDSTAESLVRVFETLDAEIVQALERAWNKCPVDLARPLASEIYGALMTRQIRFVRHLLGKPDFCNNELGGLVLRAMAESAITLGWLVRVGNDEDREQFWLYGLGQEKLALDHLSAAPLSGVFLSRRREQDIATRREWLESQQANQLLPVSLSNWTTLGVRQLADQSGLIDTYNAVYGPMSAHVHGSWNAIGRTCMRYCLNPLHRFHMIPDVEAVGFDLTVPLTALRVLQDGWAAFRVWAPALDELTCCDRTLDQIARALDSSLSENTADDARPGDGGAAEPTLAPAPDA